MHVAPFHIRCGASKNAAREEKYDSFNEPQRALNEPQRALPRQRRLLGGIP